GLTIAPDARTDISNAEFTSSDQGVRVDGGTATIRGSSFTSGTTGVTTADGSQVSIEDSTFTELSTGVALNDRRTTVSDSSFDQIYTDTIKVNTTDFDPANIATGNTATNSTINGVYLVSPVFADGATLFGRTDWGLVISNRNYWGSTEQTTNIPADTTVTAPPGTVVKFRYVDHFPNGSSSGSLNIAGTLNATGTPTNPVVFTSFTDDTAGGDTNGNTNEPPYGGRNFGGIHTIAGARINLDHTSLRHASTALTINDSTATVTNSEFIHNTNAISVSAGSRATITTTRFAEGTTGVIVHDDTVVTINNDTFSQLQTGVQLYGPDTVVSHSSFDQIYTDTIALGGVPYDHDAMSTGNVATRSAVNGIRLRDTVFRDGDVLSGRGGWDLVISNERASTVNVPKDVTVILPAGAVVKSQGRLPIVVEGKLSFQGSRSRPVVFTSWRDHAADGARTPEGEETPPQTGDWAGISFSAPLSGTLIEHAVFRYASTAISIGMLSGMVINHSQFAFNAAAFSVATTADTIPYGGLACIPPYTSEVYGVGNYYGPWGFPGVPFDTTMLLDLILPGDYGVLLSAAQSMYGSPDLTVNVGGNTIPWEFYKCLDIPTFPVTPIHTPPALSPPYPDLAEPRTGPF
ncbi:MAG: right-handed parallel beta-helix repeat-containing protein, partial [Nocardioides sp.]